MKQLYSFLFFLVFTTSIFANQIGFARNIGQIIDENNVKNKSIIYNLRLENFNINLKRNGFNYDFYEINKKKIKTHRIEFSFKNTNPNYKILHQDKINYFENFIDGSNDYKIEFYRKIIYKDFYPSIDLEFYVNEDQSKPFEYNFVLHPGADINQIKFEIKGAKTKLNSNTLNFKLRFGELSESLPKSWIEEKRKSKPIDVEYCYHNDGSIGLQTNQSIKNSKVIIDPLPIRKWGSYLSKYTHEHRYGGNHTMFIDRVKFYKSDIYIFGTTNQFNLATTGAFQTIKNLNYHPFITKFNKSGDRVWFTYFGTGDGMEYSKEIDIDNDGNIYVGFTAYGYNFATPGAYQYQKKEAGDMLIAKLSPEGKRLWATYYGGRGADDLRTLVVDKTDQTLYIGGTTNSDDIHISKEIVPTNTFHNNIGKGVIAKFDLNGKYIWSSYTLTSHYITVDNNHNLIFIDGNIDLSESSEEFSSTKGNFTLSKYDKDLKLVWKRRIFDPENGLNPQQVINENYHIISRAITDSEDNILIIGATRYKKGISFGNSYSPDYLMSNEYWNLETAGYLKKYSSAGEEIFGTYIGDRGKSFVSDIVIGNNDEIIIAGDGNNNPKTVLESNHFQENFNNNSYIGENGLLMKFDKFGSPIFGFIYGDKSRFNRFVGVDYDKKTNDLITVGWNNSPYMISTPNGFQTKPIYEPESDRLAGNNGTIVLFSDVPNDFKIDKAGDDCFFDTLIYTASGAKKYTWYDYDGNIVSNSAILKPSKVGQYTCKFEDDTNVGYISVIANEANINQPPNPLVKILPTLSEYCNIKLEAPKAISACGEELIATTDKIFFDVAGNYEITWIYTDKFGNTATQKQKITVLAIDNIIPNELSLSQCDNIGNEVYDLTKFESSLPKANYTYYETEDDLNNNTPIKTPNLFINKNKNAEIIIKGTLDNGCSSTNIITLNVMPKPEANNLNKILCDSENIGLILFDLNTIKNEINNQNDTTIHFYTDNSYTSEITSPINISNNQIIYTKVISKDGCINNSTIIFTLSTHTLLTSTPFQICKNDGAIGEFDLYLKSKEISSMLGVNENEIKYFDTLENAKNNLNTLTGTYLNNSKRTSIYATSTSTEKCKTYIEIPLIENLNPIITIQDEYIKCKNSSIEIDLNQSYKEITWSTGEKNVESISITNPGKYSVTVSNESCSITREFEVKDYNDLNIEYKYDGKIVTFTSLNDFNIQYSLDGFKYSPNPTFILETGEYTFYFKSSNGCIETKKIYLYKDIPNMITPNGDGKNDKWDLSYIKELKYVKVFNRSGRTIFEADKSKQPIIWDGKYQLKPLASDTYWYVIDLENGNKLQGSLLIKNK